jgi:hypothetical protein
MDTESRQWNNSFCQVGRIVDMLYVQNSMMGGADGTEPLRLIQVHWFQSQKPKLECVVLVVLYTSVCIGMHRYTSAYTGISIHHWIHR